MFPIPKPRGFPAQITRPIFDGCSCRTARPALWLQGGILIGLGLIIIGSFCILPASTIDAFNWYLVPLFVLALGLTCLETIANPYTTVLGSPEKGALRINIAQTCNGVGWILGPTLAAYLAYSGSSNGHGTIYKPILSSAHLGRFFLSSFFLLTCPTSRLRTSPSQRLEPRLRASPFGSAGILCWPLSLNFSTWQLKPAFFSFFKSTSPATICLL